MQSEDDYEMAYFQGYTGAQKAIALSNTLWVRFALSASLFVFGVLVGSLFT